MESSRVRAAPCCISISDELLADGLHRIAVQTEERATPGRQLDQIEGIRPTLFLASRRLLDLATIIPDVVDRPRMSTKALGVGCILNAVSIGEDHTLHLIGPLSHARGRAEWNLSPRRENDLSARGSF